MNINLIWFYTYSERVYIDIHVHIHVPQNKNLLHLTFDSNVADHIEEYITCIHSKSLVLHLNKTFQINWYVGVFVSKHVLYIHLYITHHCMIDVQKKTRTVRCYQASCRCTGHKMWDPHPMHLFMTVVLQTSNY